MNEQIATTRSIIVERVIPMRLRRFGAPSLKRR
jgi:hypothetical protein